MTARPLFSAPARDAASRFLREHADGAPLYPGGSLASAAAVERRARRLDGSTPRQARGGPGSPGAAWAGDRGSLAAWLAEQNAFAPLHPAQEKSLADAARPDTLFVLTGQQPGLLGGPALTLCKALTAVARARAASGSLKRPVVPIFWAAGDDSDLAESNAVEFLEPGARATSAAPEFPDPDAAIPMSLRVPSAESLRALWEKLPAAWDAETRALAEECYAPGRSLTESFLRLLQRLLGSEGVLFVDGFSAAQRPEAQAVLRRAAGNTAAFHESLLRGTARLRETLNLPAQVPVRPGTIPAFLLENGQRVRLFASDSGRVYAAGAEGEDLRPALSRKTLLHSALTRPLVVEALFPVLGHVLGPAELRYFAQLADVFPAFGFSFPPLAPRAQALAVPESGIKALVSLGFRAEELPDLRPSRVRERLTEAAWKDHAAARDFPDADYRRFQDALTAYRARRFPGGNFDAALRRLDRSFGHYREQARRLVFAEGAAERFRALQPLLRWIAGGQQDRHLNLLSLRAALGADGFAEWTAFQRRPEAGGAVTVYARNDPEGGSR